MLDTLKQISNRNKAIMAVVLAAVLCVATFAISSYPRDMRNFFVDSGVESVQKNLDAAAVYANESIEANYTDIQILQDMLAVELAGDKGYNKRTYAAMKIVKKRGGFDRIGIMRADSDLLFATLSDGTRQQLDMWTVGQDVKVGQVNIEMQTSPFQTADGGYDAIVYTSRFKSNTGKEYLLIAEKSQDTLAKLLSAEQVADGLSLVVRDNGNIVYDDGSLDGKEFSSYNLLAYLSGAGGSQAAVDTLKKALEDKQSGSLDVTLNGTDCTFVYHSIENTNWIAVQGYSKEALAGSNLDQVNSRTMYLVALVAALLIAVLAAVAVIGIHRAKEEGHREYLEREHLFEEMSRHIPSAILILEEGNSQPRFKSFNFDEVVPQAPESFSRADVTQWLGSSITEEDVSEFDKQGRLELDIDQAERVLRVGIYSLGLINGCNYSVMIVTDVTAAVESRRLLEDSMARADDASRSKSSFLSSMSHEIRTPLNAVLGFSKLALGKWDTATREELHEYLEKIQSSGSYLLELVSDILDISRIEEGRMEVNKAPMALGDLVGEVRDAFQGQMAGKNITYQVEENFEPVVLDMDAFHVRQVLNNLVSNACKYTEEGGTVTFTTSLTKLDGRKASVRFEVRDSGIGMTPEFQERIFEPFAQEERGAQMKKQLRGSGLGMSICKNLVDLQGGTIAVESEVGKGSCFVVQMTFDIVGNVADAENAAAERDTACLKGAHVLIADDMDLNRMILGDFLEEYGVTFDEVENGKEALEKFQAQGPGAYCAIFMDGRMPIMDGYEAATAIRACGAADAKEIPIIAMTADAFSDDVNHAIMCGMTHHLTKPIDFDKVLDILVEACTGKE